jgi:hypothetical protein
MFARHVTPKVQSSGGVHSRQWRTRVHIVGELTDWHQSESQHFSKSAVDSFACLTFINAVPRRHDSAQGSVAQVGRELSRNRRGIEVRKHELVECRSMGGQPSGTVTALGFRRHFLVAKRTPNARA